MKYSIGTGKPRKIKKIIETIKKLTKGGKPNYGKGIEKRRIKIFLSKYKKLKNILIGKLKLLFKRFIEYY